MKIEARENSGFPAALGKRIAEFRVYTRLSQEEFAAKLKGTKRGLQDNEAGKSTPGSRVLLAFAELGVNVNWLLTGKGDMLQIVPEPTTPPVMKKLSDEEKLTLALESVEESLQLCPVDMDAKTRSALIMLVFDAVNEEKTPAQLRHYAGRLLALMK